jgi:ribosomal protein S4
MLQEENQRLRSDLVLAETRATDLEAKMQQKKEQTKEALGIFKTRTPSSVLNRLETIGFVPTSLAARQLVSHGFVLVNAVQASQVESSAIEQQNAAATTVSVRLGAEPPRLVARLVVAGCVGV